MANEQIASIDPKEEARRVADAIPLPDVNTPDFRLATAKKTVTGATQSLDKAPPVNAADQTPKPGERLLYKNEQNELVALTNLAVEAKDPAAKQIIGQQLNELLRMDIPKEATFMGFQKLDGKLTVFYKLPRVPGDKSISGLGAMEYKTTTL